MGVNIENKVNKKRLSIITDIIIFLFLLNIFLFGFKFISDNFSFAQNLALEDIEITNKNYIEANYIKDEYGIKVLFGEDSYEQSLRVDAVIQEDEYVLNDNLNEIKDALKKYPDAFFKDINLTIIIFDRFVNNNIALASRNKLNEFKIYITDNSTFERSFHHEMFHIFEYKLNVKKSNVFLNWDEFNPEDFEYTSDIRKLNNKYIYSYTSNLSEMYFVTKYSKTSAKEDRAEIFAEIMTFKSRPNYLNEGSNIHKKAKYITDVMSNNLTSGNSSTFYWNRF